MLLFSILQLLVTIVLVAAQSLELLAQSLDTQNTTPIGKIQFSDESASVEIVDVPATADVVAGQYCLGARIKGFFKCYTLVEVRIFLILLPPRSPAVDSRLT